MGSRHSGPKTKPTALKLLRGVTRKDRLNTQEPKAPSGPVEKPAGLSVGASGIWDELATVCLEMGTLTAADVRPMAKLCELEATFAALVKTKGRKDYDVRLERETANALRPYYAMFGLEPSSRSRIHVKRLDHEPVSKWAGAMP